MDECCRVYEEPSLLEMDGGTIRPGGMALTVRALELFPVSPGSRVLDAGCGAGASLAHLRREHSLQGVGIDLSRKLLNQARRNNIEMLLQGQATQLPLADGSLDAVFAECSLSLMGDLAGALQEFRRVLKQDGLLVLSDIYLRRPQYAALLRELPFESCLSGARSREELLACLEENDFKIELWEDHTPLLNTYAARLIFTHGSMAAFWGCVSCDQAESADVKRAIRLAKPGYYLCVIRKQFVPK